MLALIILALIACESASSFDYKLGILNEQKKNINIQKNYVDLNIEKLYMQKRDLDREIEKIDRKKEYLDSEIEKLERQKDNLDRETDIIYKNIDNFESRIDYLNIQKDQLDNEIEKINLEEEVYNIDSDLYRYNTHHAAVENNEYSITINLPGYNENEIVVKSGRGHVVIQALRNVLGEPKRRFQNIRRLPYFVTENGSWSYKWGVLKIFFPVIQRTKYETNNVIYPNGAMGKSDLEKKYASSSTDKSVLPTTYVSKYDVKGTTPVTSQGDGIVTKTDSKSQKGVPTTYSSSQKEGIEKTTEVKPTTYSSSKKNGVETTTNVKPISQRGDVASTLSVTKQDDDVIKSIYIPN